METNLLHLANFNSTNIGNGALALGLENTLNEDLGFPINWRHEAWDDYTFGLKNFDDEFVRKINATDGLVVCGAVTFNGRPYNNVTGTRFELPFDLWNQIQKPVVFYGLSYRHWPNQIYHHSDKLKKFVKEVTNNNLMLFAVRNDGTKAWLERMTEIVSERIIEIPDSAIFVNADNAIYTEVVEDKKNILIAFNDEDSEMRYASDTINERRNLIEKLVFVIEELANRYELNIILCPHYHDDFAMIADFIKLLKPKLAHQNTITTGLNRVSDTAYFYGRYCKVDLALSMRVHSMSPCIGLCVPMVALTTQDRMTQFMKNLSLEKYAVNPLISDASKQILDQAVSILEDDSVIKESFTIAREKMRNEISTFNNVVRCHLGKV